MQHIPVDKDSKLFFAGFFLLILCSLSVLYWRHMVLESYTVYIPEELGGEADARDPIPNPENLDL
jgi:hypothetical protein